MLLRPLATLVLLSLVVPAATDFRSDRLSLNGPWRFQLRHDNALLAPTPVQFGPVSASSQAALLEAAVNMETSAGRWFTSSPVPLAGTILPAEAGSNWSRQIWKPHPKQQGPTWWQIDFGAGRNVRAVAGVRINWVKPAAIALRAEVSEDGAKWTEWAAATSAADSPDTWLRAAPARARYLRLHFLPAQFGGTRLIEVFFRGPDGSLVPWLPLPQKAWYRPLRRFTPSDGFHLPVYDDASWSTLAVPSYWELAKHSEPTWWQPDDAVGYYRRTFTPPDAWKGRQVRLRFEGVNNSAQVWINGREVGYHESGFTVFEFDVTPYLKFGQPNLIAVRVAKWTLTHEYDTDDVWFLGGIWRDTSLYALPAQRIDDYTLRTEFDSAYQDAVLRAAVVLAGATPASSARYELSGELSTAEGGRVPVEGLNAAGLFAAGSPLRVELGGRVRAPLKWTAETPHLYTLTLRLALDGRLVHQVKTTLGFRQIEVRGDKLLINGVPLRVHGTVTTRANPHDAGEPAATVFAREIRILKESNINMIRSHTTPLEEEFLDLCDKHGIYVAPDVPGVWLNEGDYRHLADGEVLRAREIYEQHKNRAAVVMWHIGNENGPSSGYRPMGQASQWLHDNDPTRPVAICDNEASVAEYGAAVKDFHYYGWPPLNPTAAPFLMGEFHGVPEEVDRLKDRGFIETWGRSLKGGWGLLDGKPWVVGALMCCWDDGSVNGDYGPRQWGLVDSRRHAKDLTFHVRKAYARVRLSLANPKLAAGKLAAEVSVANQYSFVDLAGFTFRWEAIAAGQAVAAGETSHRVPPRTSATFPLALDVPANAEILRVTVRDREGFSVQDEDFALTSGAFGRKAAAVLAAAGFVARPGAPRDFRYEWTPGAGLTLSGVKGGEWLTVPGLVLQTGKNRRTNIPLGEIRYGEAVRQPDGLSIPFQVVASSGDALAAGRLSFSATRDSLAARYEFTAAQALSLREIGLALRLPSGVGELAWNRDALWNSAPAGWLDGPREKASPAALAASVSRRNLYWLAFAVAGRPLLVAPAGETFQLRFASAPDGIVLSDFLDSPGFLGKYDLATLDRKLGAGETFSGGFTVQLLPVAAWARLP